MQTCCCNVAVRLINGHLPAQVLALAVAKAGQFFLVSPV